MLCIPGIQYQRKGPRAKQAHRYFPTGQMWFARFDKFAHPVVIVSSQGQQDFIDETLDKLTLRFKYGVFSIGNGGIRGNPLPGSAGAGSQQYCHKKQRNN